MNKLKKIIWYKENVYKLVEIDYETTKTHEEYLENYKNHDSAEKYVIAILHSLGIKSIELGVSNERHRKTKAENDIPDQIAMRNNEILFCYDIKWKRVIDWIGWVNEGAIKDYRKFSNECNVSVYAIFVLTKPNKKLGYVDTKDKHIDRKFSKKGSNWVLIFNWMNGLPLGLYNMYRKKKLNINTLIEYFDW